MLRALRRLSLCALGLLSLVWPAWAAEPAAGPIRFVLAIYFLEAPAADPMAVVRHHLATMPQAPRLVDTLPKRPATAFLSVDDLRTARQDYPPPSSESLKYHGRGLSAAQVDALQRSERALVFVFAHPSAGDVLPAYRRAITLVAQVARDTGGVLWDEETREVFSLESWQRRRLDSWSDGLPDVSRQIVIHAYEGDHRLARAITLGMAKFARPDVVVERFSWSEKESVSDLVNAMSQVLVEGSTPRLPGVHRLDLRTLRQPRVRQAQVDGLLPNARGVAELTLVRGTREDGDPDNPLLEIRFDRHPGPDAHARRNAALGLLFGTRDTLSYVRHDDAVRQASEAARARLPALREAFNKGLRPGEHMMVKAPFKTPEGGNEWMWVEVTAWDGSRIRGLLNNQPANVPGLHAGQMVEVSMEQVFDYLKRDGEGREEGNETGRLLNRQAGKR
jgi:uncharacterized protein YegJ (DUF2314 family)